MKRIHNMRSIKICGPIKNDYRFDGTKKITHLAISVLVYSLFMYSDLRLYPTIMKIYPNSIYSS